ncbi:transglutaminase domain-containing protein [uncultured Sulfitobacter sp.]|uniref:transglutaminase domain-containing protein n=1 Tax=uncultured Sulfitobacter sp. TaxID=191468 RepID=UPI00262D40CA|nr:transglutaminase domain-containing protein [uncultured Sulfitobacter sp.]
MVLADSDHPVTQAKAQYLMARAKTDRKKIKHLFLFVHDEIALGFPQKGDLVLSSETIQTGMGQCDTKTTQLLALCRASFIPSRIHFALIGKDIQRGLFSGIVYWLMPQNVSHSWIKMEIEGAWRRIDNFINDMPIHKAAEHELRRRGWNVGSSLAYRQMIGRVNLKVKRLRERSERHLGTDMKANALLANPSNFKQC